MHTLTSIILFEQRRFGLGWPSLHHLLGDFDFPARTISETGVAYFVVLPLEKQKEQTGPQCRLGLITLLVKFGFSALSAPRFFGV